MPRSSPAGSTESCTTSNVVITSYGPGRKSEASRTSNVTCSSTPAALARSWAQLALHVRHGRDPERDQQVLEPAGREPLHAVPYIIRVGALRHATPVRERRDQLIERTD